MTRTQMQTVLANLSQNSLKLTELLAAYDQESLPAFGDDADVDLHFAAMLEDWTAIAEVLAEPED